MANIYRIYLQGDDLLGWHTAIFYDKDLAIKYFKSVRTKHPNDMVISERLDDDTGNILSQKVFGKTNDVSVAEVKACRQECINLIRYDVEFKDTRIIAENISPEEANQIIISEIGQPGYGTEYIYTIGYGNFVNHVPAFPEF